MGRTAYGARPPSQVAYYVALVGVVILLAMLCCYFLYFCVTRVKELTKQEYSSQPAQASAPRPSPTPASYPVQPVVRDSASAMAKLCRQLPTQQVGGTVFPTTDTHIAAPSSPASVPKVPAPVITIAPAANEVSAGR